MSYAGLGQDRTAQDWAAGIRAGGELVSSLITAANRGSGTTSSAPPPSSAPPYIPPYTPPPSSGSSWTIPLLVGGVAIVGIGAYFMISRRSVNANRARRSRRRK